MSNILKIAASGVEAAPTGYQISRSLRFNSADSAYLSRTPASAGNRTVWTFSCWIKRGKLTTAMELLNTYSDSNNQTSIMISATAAGNADTIRVYNYVAGSFVAHKVSTLVLRDPSSWYHLLVAWDTGEAAADRIKIYVNNELITSFTTNINAGTENTFVNATNAHFLSSNNGAGRYFDGYMADVYLIDGQALTPSDFGETDATTGVWKPKAYTGTYGTNGFYLDFSDNSSTTALGYDAAGSNNWTPNNFSVTAGAGNDSMVDTPTPYGTDTGVGGEVRGNYCTLNPLATVSDTLSNGALDWVGGLALNRITKSSFGVTTGKWYAEFTYTGTNNGTIVGICAVNSNASGGVPTDGTYAYTQSGNKYVISTSSAYGASWTTNDVIGIALDLDADEITFYKNNSSQGAISITIAGPFAFFCIGSNTNDKGTWNFGQRPFAYTAPSGFKALCTQNLPTPTVVQGDDYFNTVLYTGTGSSQSITGVGFQPDWVWIKERSGAADHGLYDAVRGVQQQLESNTTDAETTESTGLTAFGTDGFTVGSLAQLNTNTDTYVAWNWNAGGSNATNTDGNITSTVRANTTAGFSIVSYTGNGTSNQTVGHGLGVAPAMIIVKNRDVWTYPNWYVWHKSLAANNNLQLDGTVGSYNFVTGSSFGGIGSSPTTTTFLLQNGTSTNQNVNDSGDRYISYVFAEIEGFSKFGSYTGNGIDNGPFVFCGFRPAFVMVKRFDTSGHSWGLVDMTRDPYNVCTKILQPNAPDKDYELETPLDALSNGFKVRDAPNSWNASGGTYIFVAFAENPFKYSLAR